jgi:autotransporter-associated beta strand protein
MKKMTQGATRLLVLALGLGLVTTGWARVKPIAVWNGDFADGAERGGFTLDRNGNTISSGIITIDGTTGGAKFDTGTAYNTKHFSAVIGLENVSTPSEYGAIITAYQTESNANRSPDMAGCAIDSSGKIKGIWNSSAWGTAAGSYPVGNSRNYVVYYAKHLTGNGTPEASGGGSWVYLNKNTTSEFGAANLRGSGIDYYGYTVGGKRSDGTHQLTNSRVVYIALFPGTDEANGATDSDLRAWSLPAMTSAETISSSGGDITSGDRSAYGVNLNGGTVNVTADTTIAALFVQADTTLTFASDAELTINGPIYVANNATLTLAPAMAEGSKSVITAGTVGANDGQIVAAEVSGYTTSVSISGGTISVSKTGAVQTFSYTCGGNPSGWVTTWGGETFGKYYRVGPNSSQPLVNEVRYQYHPWANLAAKSSAFSFAIYADATHMESNYGILASFGQSNNMLVLYRQDNYIKVGRYTGSGFDKGWAAGIALPNIGYHLYTITYDPTTGVVYLYLDDGVTYSTNDGTANTFTAGALANGFQIGAVYSGRPNLFNLGTGMAFSAAVGYDEVLTAGAVAALAANYPATDGSVTWTTSRDTHSDDVFTVYDMTQTGGYLGMGDGELTIPSGATVSTPHVRILNTDTTADSVAVNIAGQLNVTSTSAQKNVWAERDSLRGILWGHYRGTGTYNITGSLVGENAYLETVYSASTQAININGGLVKVKGLYANNGNSTVTLQGDGTLEVAEIPSDGNSITKNFGAGTFRVTSSQTETRAINFNAGEGDYTTLDPVANTLTLNAAAVTGTGDIDVAPSGAGKVVFASLGSSYSGNIKVSSGSAEIQGASGYAGSIEANAPLVINNADDAELSTLSGTGAITKSGAGALTITGTGTSSGAVTINNGGKIILSGNEAKIGTGSFRLTSDGAGIDIIPGAGNTITLAPDFIVSSTSGNTNPYINVGPGKFVAASTGTSTYDYGHFGGATINIANGGELELNANKQLLGSNMSGTINVASGGKLTFATYQKNAWTINLNGGAMDVTGYSTPIEVWGQRTLNVTEDSSINSVPSGSYTNPNIWINRGGGSSAVNWTINVAEDKTLSFNACIANGSAAASQGNNVVKAGAGTLALNGANGSGYTYSGSTTVNAGTLLINATQSGSAYNLAAGTTLKFGTGANLSVPSLTLPASGTVTVDVSDLNLASGGTTLMTFTSAPSADDVAAKMTVSGAVLKLEGSALKAYPLAAVVEANGTVHYCDNLSAAMSAAMITYSSTYDHLEVFSSIGETVYLDSMWLSGAFKLKCLNDAAVTVQAASAEYTAQAGAPDENGIVTYTGGNAATTYTWNWSSGAATWNRPSNWTYGGGTAATRAPVSGDTVIFNDGAAITLVANAECSAITVNGAVAISGDYGLNVSGNVTGGTGTPVLSISSADLNLSALSSVSGVALVLADSTATVLATTGATLAAVPTTTVEDSYVKTTANVGATTYSVAAKTVVTVSVGANVSLTIDGDAVADGATLKFTPGDSFTYAATPAANYTANVAVTGGTDNDGTVTVGETAITVAATATCNGATVSNVAVSYGPDYTSATVTATVSDATLDYYISWASGEPVKGTVSGSTVTFDVSGIAHSAPYQSSGYNISAKDGETTVTTTGGSGESVAADVAANWINENATTHGNAVAAGGVWTNAEAVTYSDGKATITDNRFAATTASTSSRVVLEFEVCFSSTSDEDVSGEAQAAIKLAEVNSVTTFMVLTNGNNWAAVSNAELEPNAADTYKVVLTIDYGDNAYGVTVGNYVMTNSAGIASFPLAANRSSVQNIDFAGSGTLTSMKGDQVEGYMVVDKNGTRYPSIAAAISAYTQNPSIGPLRVLHSGTPPSGWRIDGDTLIKVAKGLFFMAF